MKISTILRSLLIIIVGIPAMANAQTKWSSVSTDTDTDSDEESEQYSSGSKWTYTKDGKSYEVTMDSPTTGTYIDEDGNTHKITLNE